MEAAPEAIAEYGRTGSWDALRECVTEKKPRPTPEQELSQALAESGPAVLGAGERPQQVGEARIEKLWNTDQITHAREQGGEPGELKETLRTPFAGVDGATQPMITLRRFVDGGGQSGWGWTVYFEDRAPDHREPVEFLPNAALAKGRAIDALRRAHRAALPVPALIWLDQQLGPHFVDGENWFNAARAGERRRTLGWEARKANHGGGHAGEAKPKPPGESDIVIVQPTRSDSEAGSPPAAEPADHFDPWDRDHNAIVADEATLQRVTDFTLGHTGSATPGYAHQLLNALGLDGPFGADDHGNGFSDVVGVLPPRPFATLDVDAEGPPQRARAIALLVAWALNRTFNAERAK